MRSALELVAEAEREIVTLTLDEVRAAMDDPNTLIVDIRDVRELPYWYGDNRCVATWVRGKPCYQSDLGLT